MGQQLRLIEERERPWQVGARTRRIGLEGVAKARARLRTAQGGDRRRPATPPPRPVR